MVRIAFRSMLVKINGGKIKQKLTEVDSFYEDTHTIFSHQVNKNCHISYVIQNFRF